MKLKTKIAFGFLISIIISVLIFSFSTYYILHYGIYSGISKNDMQHALDTLTVQTKDSECIVDEQVFCEKTSVYKDMQFLLKRADGSLLSSDRDLPSEITDAEILRQIQGMSQWNKKYHVVATEFTYRNENQTLLCYVENQKFESMSYQFNMDRTHGILGKICIIGIIITLIVTGIFGAFFTANIRHRLIRLYDTMQNYHYDNCSARILDKKKDEIGELAGQFDAMADNLEKEIALKESYEQKKKNLISSLAHDLRTPMSSIIGYSEMLNDKMYQDEMEQQKYIDTIHRKAIYMNQILVELLEFSRIDSNTFELRPTSFDAAEMLREILAEYYSYFEENNFEMEINIPEEKLIGNWDRERLVRVIHNIIDNSIKYGMDGKKLSVAIRKENAILIRIEIKDYGKGISADELDHVFEQFYRGDIARNSKKGGMGLGLSIADEIIKKHGGKIVMESEKQKGVDTKLYLPL